MDWVKVDEDDTIGMEKSGGVTSTAAVEAVAAAAADETSVGRSSFSSLKAMIDTTFVVDGSSDAKASALSAAGAGAVATQQEFQQNFDEYSFGSSSDEDDDQEENGLEKMAHVSLDTTFDMQILQTSIEKECRRPRSCM